MPPFRTVIWQFVALVGVGTNAGCHVVQCLPPEPSASIVGAQSSAERPLMIRGRVVSLETGQPLRSARARVSSGNAQSIRGDANGAFSVRVARPGSSSGDLSSAGYGFIRCTGGVW